MTTTIELCRKYGIPLNSSVWTDQGLEAPEFQRVGLSNRLVETPGYNPLNPPYSGPVHEEPGDRTQGKTGLFHRSFDVMPGDRKKFEHEPEADPVPGGPTSIDIVIGKGGYNESFDIMPSPVNSYGNDKKVVYPEYMQAARKQGPIRFELITDEGLHSEIVTFSPAEQRILTHEQNIERQE